MKKDVQRWSVGSMKCWEKYREVYTEVQVQNQEQEKRHENLQCTLQETQRRNKELEGTCNKVQQRNADMHRAKLPHLILKSSLVFLSLLPTLLSILFPVG